MHSADGVYTSVAQLIDWRYTVRRQSAVDALPTLFDLPGRRPSPRSGHGTEFREIRDWQPGDDPREIDWRVSARRADLMVRQHQDTRECPLFLVVDQRADMFFGSAQRFKSITAVDAAALLSWIAHGRDDRLGGLIFGGKVAPLRCGKGRQHLLQWLQQLSQANGGLNAGYQDVSSLDDAIQAALVSAPTGARVALISDLGQRKPTTLALLAALARKTRLALFVVRDPLERELPLAGRLGVSDGQNKTSVWFGSSLQKRYLDATAQADTQLRRWCEVNGVVLHRLSTDQPVDERLVASLDGRVA